MASETIYDLTQETAINAADRFVVQQTAASERATSATFALMGGMAVATGTDADTAMAVGTLYKVDMSGWATADRIYSLPSTAQVGERVGIFITTGDATYEMQLRTTAASNDTINGVDHDSSDWSKLFITGECIVFECITADTDWAVVYDGRIPCNAKLRLTTDITTNTAATWTKATLNTQDFDTGDIADPTTNNRMDVRRGGRFLVTAQGRSAAGLTDQKYYGVAVYLNGAVTQQVTAQASSTVGQFPYQTCTTIVDASDGEHIEMFFRSEDANMGLDDNIQTTFLIVSEIL